MRCSGEALDDGVGALVGALERWGLWNDTLLVFTRCVRCVCARACVFVLHRSHHFTTPMVRGVLQQPRFTVGWRYIRRSLQ